MPLYAVENLDDALSTTREFLLPFDAGRWLRLALVAFLVAGGSGGSGFSANGVQYTAGGATPPTGMPVEEGVAEAVAFVQANLGLILGVVAAVTLVVLLFSLIASVMEFVFVEALRSDAVRVRAYFGRYWRQGLRLFGFRLVAGLLATVAIGGLGALLVAPFLLGLGAMSAVTVVVLLPVLLVLVVFAGLVLGFTSAFVVPIMLLEDRGVLSAWRRFWPTLRADWQQYAVYAVASFVLSLVAGFVAGVAVLVPALLLAIPFVLVFAVGFAVTGGVVPLPLLGVLAALFALVLLVVVALVQVPIQTYLRYYSLLVLGDTEPEFDVIPDQRAAVRRDGEPGTGV